ncbi:MAG TPA: serine hydrolase domain-containing protein [Candidatus Dormibacteraeota bacterium]|nr:serine hydrolase domain-containing protein [Candidatus Dormibacteraeota bacterium]
MRIAVSLAFVQWAFAASAFVLAQSQGLTPEKRGQIASTVTRFMDASSVPGISVAVVQNGKPVWSEGFGVADKENYVPATSSTLYRLGSISKSITAIAVLQLSEQGKLDLDAPAQKYCPVFPQKEAPITARQLLGHLGGIRHYNPDGKGDVPEDSAKHFATMEESLQLFAADPLVAKPGAEFHYSTYGYTLLGCMLEGATSRKFVDYLRENVFQPARMDQTQADDFFSVVPHRTRWYHKDKSGVVRNAGVLDSSYKIPGGGLISSADDMANFEAAMLADKLVKHVTRDLMWSIEKTTAGKPPHYGLGWDIRDRFGLRTVGHDGGQQGTTTGMIIVPEKSAGVVVLANMDSLDLNRLAEEILRIVLDVKDKMR